MYAWEAIQSAVDHIEGHLDEEVTIDELASLAGLSPFYFQRLFKRLVNKTVMEYVKLRRLAKAADYMRTHECKIVDVAFMCGFTSHEAFSRTFKHAYGLTPEQFKRNPVILNTLTKPELLLDYVMTDEGVPVITDHIILEINRKTLTTPRYFAGIEGEVPIKELMGEESTGISTAAALWDQLYKQKAQIKNKKEDGNNLGALYMGNTADGCCIYLAATEVISNQPQDGYKIFELPAAEYIVCGFEAENESELYSSAVFKADKFFGRWMEKHQLQMTDFAIEMYYEPSEDAAYLEHWGIPIPS